MKILCRLYPLFFLLILAAAGCNNGPESTDGDGNQALTTPALSYSIGQTFQHDTSYFTQGLEFYKGVLIEGTGLNGRSRIIKYDVATGNVQQSVYLSPQFFGEGITVLRDTLYQLTYTEGKTFLYDAQTLEKIGERPLTGQGWGLTNDSTRLIASNGSSNLYFYEPGTFRLLSVQAVTENEQPALNLNELEYINGYVYANQWQYNYILKIDPTNGKVVAKMDMSTIADQVRAQNDSADFLNGIAYNPATNKVYVTGKKWPQIFEVKFNF